MGQANRVGVYICRGCGLGDRLDTAQLAQVADREGKADIVREHEFLCSESGVAMIKQDVASEAATHVMIAACSRRSKTDAFNFENVALGRTNLREGVIWVRPDTDEARETTQEMAADYVRMGCAEIKHMQVPKGNPDRGSNKRVLVVGGGVSGMTAAIEAAKTGYEVLLVEKTGVLGGMTGALYKRVPYAEPYGDPQDTGVSALIEAVDADKRISVFLNSTISRTSGAPGQFSVDIAKESGGTQTENVGAIIMASGFSNYDANQLPELGFGKTPDVVDQLGLEQLAKAADGGVIQRPSDGKAVTSVTFVQCAGQRSDKPGHLPYCSGHCCNTSIKQAMYFKDANPDIDTNIIYMDLRTPGNGEDFYRSGQRKRVTFTKGVVEEVGVANGSLQVKFKDLILNEDVVADTDLVVLATGQVANSGVDIDADAQATQEDKEAKVNQIKIPVESILNLQYRQGPDIPHLRHGFNDSHFICFPYETRRSGIYSCGPVRRPMDIAQATEDATGAALKAIQAVTNASLGRAVHPRSGDLSFPTFRREGCTQCKRCTVECPFGAIDEDEQSYPVFNESRCRRCGTCMGACPVRVISFENYSIDTVGSQLKAVDMPDEFDEKPRILVLACENDAYPALDAAGMNRLEYSAFVRTIPVRCLGSVSNIWVTDALNAGYDGVMLMGCKRGDDYQCHFVKGSELAHDRMTKIDDTLQTLSLERERVQVYEIAITDIQRVPELINDYAVKIDEIGMNPFKGF
ncbi:MAG: hydrogenase iron-sulfur subunit [Gammaproteobacteria bacterium]|jgi:quinone-modifying oxidoreductase subunit QmoB|nr:hydrogenase iron-sulfur subunit [Gammaproteobacteria bacterium]